jgi:membrane protein implicated in regulation of membrane protease activity
MAAWVVWSIVAVALAVGEILTPGLFFLGPVALAAVIAAVVAALGAGLGISLTVFIVGAVASLAVLRPIARRHVHMPARLRTGAAALVGARGLAVERIDAHGGRVKIGGEVWTARAFDETQVIEPGARVEIVKIEGATALVYE